jgi:flagellar protein FlaG
MDIFSNINSVTRKYDNGNVTQSNEVQKKQEFQQLKKNEDDFANKSKEEIKKELQNVIEELNKAMSPLNQNLQFQFNDKVNELIVQVIDKKNDIIIREFPPKEALKLMEKMRELVGLLFDKKG